MPRLPRAGSLAVIRIPATMLLVAVGLMVGGTVINAGGLVTLAVRPVRTVTPEPNPTWSTTPGQAPATPSPPVTDIIPTSPPMSPPTGGPDTDSPGPQESPRRPEQPQPQQPQPDQPQQPQQQPQGGQPSPFWRPAALHGAAALPEARQGTGQGGTTLEANVPAIATALVGLCTQVLALLTSLIGLYAGARRAAGSARGEPQPAGPRDTRPVRNTGTVRTPRGRRPRRR
jgi:hypothetical protein